MRCSGWELMACLVLVGCSGADNRCQVGTSDSCSCAEGESGTRTCVSRGVFGPCTCEEDAGVPDSGRQLSCADCDPEALCSEAGGSTSCTCRAGFSGNGATCTDVDECLANNGGCDSLTVCTNSRGGRTCGSCPAGFSGSGESQCSDIDECLASNGGCDPLTTCTNNPGGRACGPCPGGYIGDGASGCVDHDECATPLACDANATCSNTAGGFTCACQTGFGGDGGSCFDIDECAIAGTCAINEVCANTQGSHSCSCSPGYATDGGACARIFASVSGTVSGLSGSGLRLSQGADTVTVSANGAFSFPIAIGFGDPFQVSILQQPERPTQVCTISGGTGTLPASGSTSILVSCRTPPGASLFFNGASSLTTIAGSQGFNLDGTNYTIEAWVKPVANSTGTQFVWAKKEAVSPLGWRTLWTGQNAVDAVGVRSPDQGLPLGIWTHVAVTNDADAGRKCLWVNGVNSACAGPAADGPSAVAVTLGNELGGGPSSAFEGYIDEFRISSTVRYQGFPPFPPAGRFVPDPATVGLWHFDEDAGLTSVSAIGNYQASLSNTLWSEPPDLHHARLEWDDAGIPDGGRCFVADARGDAVAFSSFKLAFPARAPSQYMVLRWCGVIPQFATEPTPPPGIDPLPTRLREVPVDPSFPRYEIWTMDETRTTEAPFDCACAVGPNCMMLRYYLSGPVWEQAWLANAINPDQWDGGDCMRRPCSEWSGTTSNPKACIDWSVANGGPSN